MTSIEQLIRKELNPFDPTTFTPGNFWRETQDQSYEVTSIHEHVVDSVETALRQVATDRKTRTLVLIGDSGSGKSHLLGRVKRRLNNSACFAYIGPWPDSQGIWRHILRYTVDSLMAIPEGQTESQLMRWLQGLELFQRQGFVKRLMGERKVFIRDMSASFPSIRQAREFFSVIYALSDPGIAPIATDWLRGEDLDDEDLKLLRVKHSIDSEDAAQRIMSNLGWLADSTQPVVLCFDNLDNVPNMPNGDSGLKAMFNVNTMIHNEKLKNFLIVISLITNNWKANEEQIEYANQARVDQWLTLSDITIDQATAIWASRLRPLHAQASSSPDSSIAPLTREWLEYKHPGGRLVPRSALTLAEQLLREFKRTGKLPEIPIGSDLADADSVISSSSESDRASFELMWQKEFQGTGEHLRRVSQFSSPELIRRLQEALEALDVPKIQHAILPSPKYRSYSLGYGGAEQVCVVWTEERNLNSFFHMMKACQKVDEARMCDRIYLIRKEKLGTPKNKGYQLFQGIFSQGEHSHLKPDLVSVQYLETYHRMVNAAAGGELVIGTKTPHVKDLQEFVRESEVLSTCSLLQQLGAVASEDGNGSSSSEENKKGSSQTQPVEPLLPAIEAAERYILNMMTTQLMVGMQVLVENTQEQEPTLSSEDVVNLIHSLCNANNKLQMLDPNARPENQLLYFVPT